MIGIADNVYHYLVAKGITYSMYIGEEPAKPDTLVSMANGGGGLPGLYLEKGKYTDYPSLTLRARHKIQKTAELMIQELSSVLIHQGSFWINAAETVSSTEPATGTGVWTHVMDIQALGSIIDFPRDSNERWIKGFNFTAIREDKTY